MRFVTISLRLPCILLLYDHSTYTFTSLALLLRLFIHFSSTISAPAQLQYLLFNHCSFISLCTKCNLTLIVIELSLLSHNMHLYMHTIRTFTALEYSLHSNNHCIRTTSCITIHLMFHWQLQDSQWNQRYWYNLMMMRRMISLK